MAVDGDAGEAVAAGGDEAERRAEAIRAEVTAPRQPANVEPMVRGATRVPGSAT